MQTLRSSGDRSATKPSLRSLFGWLGEAGPEVRPISSFSCITPTQRGLRKKSITPKYSLASPPGRGPPPRAPSRPARPLSHALAARFTTTRRPSPAHVHVHKHDVCAARAPRSAPPPPPSCPVLVRGGSNGAGGLTACAVIVTFLSFTFHSFHTNNIYIDHYSRGVSRLA